MGTLDFLKEFENRAIDAASYKLLKRNFQMQDDNNRLYREKAELLAEENARLITANQSLRAKIDELTEMLTVNAEAAQFMKYEGIAFRRLPDGTYEEVPYCPNCYSVMGNLTRKSYQCSSCNYQTKVQILPEITAQKLNAEFENKS
tara:strand:- start:2073 stop:2510 length:438 start_codon:yes stop_codon:yes gene_type:complete